MARPERFRDIEADRIVAAYERAKRANPKLSQGEFMQAARPGQYKSRESAGRYFRLLREGKRSGKHVWYEATGERVYSEERKRWERVDRGAEPEIFQLIVTDKAGNKRSFNIGGAGGRSAFDVAAMQAKLEQRPDLIDKKAREWASRYDIQLSDLQTDQYEIRHVRQAKAYVAEWFKI